MFDVPGTSSSRVKNKATDKRMQLVVIVHVLFCFLSDWFNDSAILERNWIDDKMAFSVYDDETRKFKGSIHTFLGFD